MARVEKGENFIYPKRPAHYFHKTENLEKMDLNSQIVLPPSACAEDITALAGHDTLIENRIWFAEWLADLDQRPPKKPKMDLNSEIMLPQSPYADAITALAEHGTLTENRTWFAEWLADFSHRPPKKPLLEKSKSVRDKIDKLAEDSRLLNELARHSRILTRKGNQPSVPIRLHDASYPPVSPERIQTIYDIFWAPDGSNKILPQEEEVVFLANLRKGLASQSSTFGPPLSMANLLHDALRRLDNCP